MSGATRQGAACRRAEALARGLRRDLGQALREGAPPAAADLRAALKRIDAALDSALRFDTRPDPDLAYRRAHARNVALVLRRTVEASLGAEAAGRADLLSRAMRFADELNGTIGWIRQRAPDLAAPPPARPWTASWAGRLLAMPARLLPPEVRFDFVEDQCGNLASVESRREWIAYLCGLLTRMPRIAAAASRGRSR